MGVEIIHWNPKRRRIPGPIGRLLPSKSKVNNFGDLLGPFVVKRILEARRIPAHSDVKSARLLAVGSILHMAKPQDVIWGSGINGKVLPSMRPLQGLDVRAVRGPITRDILVGWGVTVPEVYGDPALLLGTLWPSTEFRKAEYESEVLIVPNFLDFEDFKEFPNVLDPTSDLMECLCRIGSAQLVVGSSLHGLVVAEALGVPARLIGSTHEHQLKYEDYYLGTGRRNFETASSVRHAMELGGEIRPSWDSKPLLHAFPLDLWDETAPIRS